MTTYIISGSTLVLDADGGDGNIDTANTINPITGDAGVGVVRIMNTSAGNVATVGYTLSDETYSFANIAGTPSGAGANAKFNVTVANSGYQVEIASGGNGYSNTETISILGTSVGGSTTANDLTLTLTVGTVGGKTGVVTSVATAGTAQWPQSETGNITILPRSENFVQVASDFISSGPVGAYFSSTGQDGNVYITPVTVIRSN
jgi:hypothetical protein